MLHIYDDEVNEPLTPSHLMYGRRLLSIKCGIATDCATETNPKKRYEYLNKLLMQFWEMFQHQYLTSLRERDLGSTEEVDTSVGDVVLIKTRILLEMHGHLEELRD